MIIDQYHEIQLGEDEDISKVQLLRAGEYEYYDNTKLTITSEMLQNMKKNFDSKVKKIDLAIDYSHMAHLEAAGWITAVTLENDDSELWITVNWNDEAAEKIKNKKYRYLSADFEMNYRDNESGKEFGATLNGGGLTNRPFVKGMNPILDEISGAIDKHPEKLQDIKRILKTDPIKGNEQMTFDELKQSLVSVKLSDDEKKEAARLLGFESNEKQLSDKIAELEGDVKDKNDKIIELNEKITLSDKEAEFAVLLSEGKAVPAQKDSFLKGDLAEFVKLSVETNPEGSNEGGSANAPEGDSDEPKDAEAAQEKVVELAQAKMKDNKELSEGDAYSLVLSENPKLEKLIEG